MFKIYIFTFILITSFAIPLDALVLISGTKLNKKLCEASFSWEPNTETYLSGYRVYYGGRSGKYHKYVETTDTTIDLVYPASMKYFAATAFSLEEDVESDYSDEVFYDCKSSQ